MGVDVRRSQRANPTTKATPISSGPATNRLPQGWVDDSMRPKVMPSRPKASPATPTVSRWRALGSRDSATARRATARPTTAMGTLTQKIDDQSNTDRRRPPTTGPRPKPKPAMAAQIPKAPARRAGG